MCLPAGGCPQLWEYRMQGDLHSAEGEVLDELISVFQFIGEYRINNSEMEVEKKSFSSK